MPKCILIAIAVFLTALVAAPAARAAEITLDTTATGAPISKYIYGQFIEHLGRCIYGGIWAEMLQDRKFFYAPGADESPWKPLGQVDMRTENAYVGEHTLRVTGKDSGLQQSGLGLVQDARYTGRIVLAGSPDAAPIAVTLRWGSAPTDAQTIVIPAVSADFAKYPLEFTAGAATDDAQLSIVVQGAGHLDIGTVSLMPADNIRGMRADTLALLKELNAPIYRWPGGNFVSGYDFHDGLGDPDKRPPRKNPAWTGVEHNDFGADEYIAFCREIGTEPLVVVNSGLGNLELATEELEYFNGAAATTGGAKRAANGHAEPYTVHWWGIGNEMYGNWQLGHIPLEDYVKKHNAYAEAMTAIDPSIQLIGVGDSGSKWSETMLAQCAGHIDLLSEHFYCQEKKNLRDHIRQIPDAIHSKVERQRRYLRDIPALAGKKIPICMDEWNYWYGDQIYGELGTRYYLKDALGIAEGLHEYFRSSDIVQMACYAQTVNVIGCIKTTKTAACFDATGQVLRLYRKVFGTIPIAVKGDAGALDVMAAWTEDNKAITLGVVNPKDKDQTFRVNFNGAAPAGNASEWTITAPDLMSTNTPGEPEQVRITGETPVTLSDGEFTVSPYSITLFRIETR